MAYRLEFPPGTRIHNVFHISQLRKCLGPVSVTSSQLPPSSVDAPVIPQPKLVLNRHTVQKSAYRPKDEVLVQWQGAPSKDATWKDVWRFAQTDPDFSLADKGS